MVSSRDMLMVLSKRCIAVIGVLHLSPCGDGNFIADGSASKLTRDVVDKVKVAKCSSDSGASLKRLIG
jgi:hypothetical protein